MHARVTCFYRPNNKDTNIAVVHAINVRNVFQKQNVGRCAWWWWWFLTLLMVVLQVFVFLDLQQFHHLLVRRPGYHLIVDTEIVSRNSSSGKKGVMLNGEVEDYPHGALTAPRRKHNMKRTRRICNDNETVFQALMLIILVMMRRMLLGHHFVATTTTPPRRPTTTTRPKIHLFCAKDNCFKNHHVLLLCQFVVLSGLMKRLTHPSQHHHEQYYC